MSTVPANASTALSATLVDELVRGGLRHVVLAPGSRSAALGFALHAAAATGRLTLHTRIDERSAAFLALGLATTSRSPVAVVTTSGTAVANLHPAVLEASHRGLPLLALSADRPAYLRGTQANQTTDQVRIFGTATRLDADVPPGDPGGDQAAQVRFWRELACRALAAARGEGDAPAGPVQLNLQLVEPMVPDVADGWTAPVDGRPDGAPWAAPAVDRPGGPTTLETGPRTVVIAGDDAGPPARILAERGGWPLLAEPTSGSRTGENAIRAYRLLLGDLDLVDRIERVVVCGHPTLSRPVTRLISSPDVEVLAVRNATGYTDPGHRVARVLEWPVEVAGENNGEWLAEWKQRDADRSRALDAFLAGREALTPHQVARAVSEALPPEGLLFVGPSNPVRDLDLMVARYKVGDRRLVIGNRGLAGIDGCVSTALGAVLGRPRTTRAFALLGDVTFLHDTNGLLIGPDEARPDLTIVVVNDDGGSIFASLEQGDAAYADSYDKLFGTPHRVDLASLCAATRTPHWKVDTLAELRQALASPNGGIEVVEAVVTRHDRRSLDAALRGLGAQD
ncbi:MAG: 2-succinyl-5-enolpyruvyl-6-hydroxy-3-cyclohexene-1-carboxylic-acid synthase [Nocardioides sp.]